MHSVEISSSYGTFNYMVGICPAATELKADPVFWPLVEMIISTRE